MYVHIYGGKDRSHTNFSLPAIQRGSILRIVIIRIVMDTQLTLHCSELKKADGYGTSS